MMPTRLTATGMLTAVLIAGAAPVAAETAADSFAKGEALLAKGDFRAAQQWYAAAARADQENQEYVQHYAMVRRIVDLRSRLETERDPERWENMARALHAFYVTERIYSELLKLDRSIHARLGSAESAAMLAETHLALGQNADAAKTLAALEPGKATAMSRTLLGIALVRSGKKDEGRRIAAELALPEDEGPGTVYAAARLHAGIGNSAKAVELLKPCFEAIPASLLEGFKTHARHCPEFATIASTPEFAGVLKTESKVPESKCSGGSSCAGCPMAGKCPKSQGK